MTGMRKNKSGYHGRYFKNCFTVITPLNQKPNINRKFIFTNTLYHYLTVKFAKDLLHFIIVLKYIGHYQNEFLII